MKLLTQSGIGRQKAPISQGSVKSQVRFAAVVFASVLMLVVTGLTGCAGLTGAAPNGNQQDQKSPVLSMGSSTITFGNVAVGSTASQSLTITNTGTAAATISQATISGTGFTVVGAVPSGTIGVGQTLTVQVQFAPQSTGVATGAFALASDASNSPASTALSGTGTAASLTASPTSLNFGTVDIGSNATKSVTLTNAGSASVTISGITATGTGISVSGLSLPATVNAGANATFTVQFNPSSSGSTNGSISIASTAPTNPITVAVTGAGAQAQITANPASVNFGSVVDGNTNSQPIQISNTGSATLTISQISMSGGNNSFGLSGISTPLVIQAGKSASFNALFGPSSTGNFSGTISLVSNAPNSPLTINLAGTGGAITRTLSASTTSVNFGNVADGTTATQNVTITNTGNTSVMISTVTPNGTGFGESGVSGGTTLEPNQTSTLTVAFDPTNPGSASGGVTLYSNASNSPMSIAFSGTGIQETQHSVALAWTASTSTGVVGYYVYRGTQSGNYAKISGAVTSTSYTDSTVQSGQNITYYYVVTAVNSSGTESTDSNQATATVQ